MLPKLRLASSSALGRLAFSCFIHKGHDLSKVIHWVCVEAVATENMSADEHAWMRVKVYSQSRWWSHFQKKKWCCECNGWLKRCSDQSLISESPRVGIGVTDTDVVKPDL